MKKNVLLGVLPLLCLYLVPISQNKLKGHQTITGTARNTAGEPLSGTTVTNTRTGKGTVTNAAGVFTLPAPVENDQLRIVSL